jgi:LAGLIDADG-like domain
MASKEWSASAELNRMRSTGLTLPKNPVTRRVAARDMLDMVKTPGSLNAMGSSPLLGPTEGRQRLNSLRENFGFEGMAKTIGRTAAATGSDAQWAWPKLHDPFEYWRERTWWFNMEDPDEQTRKIRDWARLLYTTHYLVPSLIDIYTRYPLLDIEFVHHDKRISDFYNELFFDGLNYQEFLFDLGREHWTVGEAFAMGSWHDGIGAWEEDEIINPNDVIVAKNRALRTYQFHVKVPQEIKRLIERREPAQEYQMLMQLYPDVVAWARQDKEIPVSDVIMKQIKFKCVTPDTDVLTPSGPVPAGDLKVGDPVFAWDTENDRVVVSHVQANSLRDPETVVKITTKFGRTIKTTLEHPFWIKNTIKSENTCLTCNRTFDNPKSKAGHIGGSKNSANPHYFPANSIIQEWVQAQNLRVGDLVRVGSHCSFGSEFLDPDLARFIGMMIGDGSYTNSDFSITSNDQEIVDWIRKFVEKYDCSIPEMASSSLQYRIKSNENLDKRAGRTGSNKLINLFREVGIFGQTCHNKVVPKIIWESGPQAWWNFLSGYLDTDGCFFDGDYPRVYWTSSNKDLLNDVQLMLSLLGVSSTLNDGCVIVQNHIGLSILSENLNTLMPRKQVHSREVVKNTYKDTVEWDAIESIEVLGEEVTCALSIANYHSHITAGLVTHNTNPWSEHGTPILLRAFRMLMLEESLNAAQDAIADRLYSPLILATLGLPDVDQDGPWIPDATELQALRDDLAMAINSDFRLMTYHHGLQIQNAFGRESMPRLDADFMRVESKIMQVFGIGADLLQGGQGGTYAAGALNRELITQMLSTYQHKIEQFIRSRMEPVAERQGHYEMRKIGGQMVPVMETVLMVDEETGAEYIEERPKLAIPEVRFRSMNLRDETIERGFLQQLQAAGFPISLGTLAVNIPIDFDDEVEARKDEKIKTVVAEQEFKRDLFNQLFTLQLPIPPEYVQEYQAYLAMLENPAMAAQLAPGAMAGLVTPPSAPNMTGATAGASDAALASEVYPSIANQTTRGTERQRPEESYEQRKSQPKPSKKGPKNGPKKKTASTDEELGTSFGNGSIIENRVEYGGRMKFAAPIESRKRKRMKLANGIKVNLDDNYEKFDEEQFKQHLAALIEASEEPMIPNPTHLDEHSSGEGGMDQPARIQIDPEKEKNIDL